ncbi:hypothetical protein [Pseudomonas sp.]|jgi:hypothetical protein|uniref:hypothetical protein n=1 Tax=Pseudomonas sp. TaxID=306 RepID=UPI002ED9C9EB
MAATLSLVDDPRWRAFADRYAFDAYRFACEVTAFPEPPTWQQRDLLNSVSPFGSRTSVSSGHGTGKTRTFGIICLWHLACYAKSNTYLTAPKLKTLQEGVWQEITNAREAIMQGPHAWIADYIVIESERVYIRGNKAQWFVSCRTAPLGRPEALAGTHNKYLLWLADEASGIPTANFQVVSGALSDNRNRFAIASQPTRPSGFFYDTHHKFSLRAGGRWNALLFNSEKSPIVGVQFILDKRLEYGGRNSAEYQVKVLGIFPTNSDKYLLGRNSIEACVNPRVPVIKPGEFYGNLLVVDVAAAAHRDKTVAYHFKVIGNGDRMEAEPRRIEGVAIPIFSNGMDWTPAARVIADYTARLSNCTVVVDAHGMGVQFAKRLEEMGVSNVIRSMWGGKNFSKRYRERFYNKRAQCSIHAKEAIEDGRVSFTDAHLPDLLDQGSRIPYKMDDNGKWQIAGKDEMQREGIPSPDLFDTVCMAFLEDVTYVQCDTIPITEAATVGQAAARITTSLAGLDLA